MGGLGNRVRLYRCDDGRGFTLVEMLVVITIISILASASVFGLMKWQESSNFKQQDEYAQILFISAQNQLAEYENTQRTERFAAALQDSGGNLKRALDVTRLTDGNGIVYPSSSAVWYESAGIGSKQEASKYEGKLCYASCVLGDYEQYRNGGAASLSQAAKDRGADIVFELLENYVYDKNILNASISVEFSPREGQVFAVCYRSNGGEFVYAAPSETASNGRINIANRAREYRKEQGVGYYGTDKLAISTADASTKLVLADVKLNNEETLNLSFRVAKPVGVSQLLTYHIEVYDADEDKLKLSFDVAGAKLCPYANRKTVPVAVTGYAYGAGNVASPVEIGTYDMLAWLEDDATVRIVLDAADIEASTSQYLLDAAGLGKAEGDKKKFAKTYSFHRFGLDAENIYCTLQAVGETYRDSAKKQTQAKAVYFASAELPKAADTTQVFTYQLANARHLYNVRYAEDLTAEKTASLSGKINAGKAWEFDFQVTDVIDWKAFVASGNLYRSDANIVPLPGMFALSGETKPIYSMPQADFPSVKQLRYGDSFSGDEDASNVVPTAEGQIWNLGLSKESNVGCGVYSAADTSVGLFLTNDGTIANLTLDGVQAEGEDSVGTFCAVNRGHLLGLQVKSSVAESKVSGQTNVGGIAGYMSSMNDSALTGNGEATPPALTYLVNEARVCGRECVGGIIGQISVPADAMQPQVTLSLCQNYGVVAAVNSTAVAGGNNLLAKQTEPRYLGGIVGYCDNSYINAVGEKDSSRLKVVGCTSAPKYTDAELAEYLETNSFGADKLGKTRDADYTGRNLKGAYVGGIVGYNRFASVEECSTSAEEHHTGYVFGYQYVGGIVGFNQGVASGVKDSVADAGTNRANVVGCRYVGGIVGCNADRAAASDSQGIAQPDRKKNDKVRLDDWQNQGIVVARDDYAGGISGYNAGWICNCHTRVKAAEHAGFFAETYSGDYAGGITAYNNGVVKSAENAVMDCYVSGDSYVGGIVGYNDVDSVIENYQIAGGRILGDKGSGMYAGGYAGFNASVRMFLSESGAAVNQTAEPDEVTGRYFVGGTVGGNIVNTKVNLSGSMVSLGELSTVFEPDNLTGELSGGAFVGGLAGYNVFIDESGKDAAVVLERELAARFRASDEGGEGFAQKINILDGIVSQIGMAASDCTLIIRDADNDGEPQGASGKITAKVCVGGVLGYNDLSTKLYVQNVRNTTPILAEEAVSNEAEQPGRTADCRGRALTYRYSYAGGILGKAGARVIIDHCWNESSGSVKTAGTYTGALCEVNEGQIVNCDIPSMSWSADNYFGGLCGLNKLSGIIRGCKFEDKLIVAQNVIGGFAAENFGQIFDITVRDAKLIVTGNDTVQNGGPAAVVAGYNGDTGKIVLYQDLGAIGIMSNAEYVGGVIGYNAGALLNEKSGRETTKLSVGKDGDITGGNYVGGLIGYNANGDDAVLEYWVNQANVTGTSGNVGGITGNNASERVIRSCENKGAVHASDVGNAGGIAAENFGVIENCTNAAEVSAPKGTSGGISAKNYEGAIVRDCVDEYESANTPLTP